MNKKDANRKFKAKLENKNQRRKNRGALLVTSVLECGCCYVKMKFKSISSANKAFKKAGLGLSMTIVDDKGVTHEGIDTFYGFWLEDE